MYCSKCNKKGKIGDIYCSECGEKLKKQTIHISEKSRNVIITLLAVLLILFISFKTLECIYSPKTVATKYFEAVINNNTDKIYSYLDEYDSDFVSLDILKEKITLFENVEDYKIVNVEQINNESIVEFQYIISGTTKTAYVLLTKDNNNFIFDNWKVDSSKLVENITIKVPKTSTITIDDKDISSYLKDDDEYYDIYEIPYMINGTYTLKTTLNDITVEDEIEVEDNKTYYVNNIELDETLKTTLEDLSVDKLNYIYSNAIAGTNFDDIKTNLSDNIEKEYKSLKRSFSNSNIRVNQVLITDIEESNATYDSQGNLQVTFVTDYSINYTYTANGTDTTNSNDSTSKVTLTFKYNNGTYELLDIVNLLNLKVRW